MDEDELGAARSRAFKACRHDICMCGEVNQYGDVIGDPLGPHPQFEVYAYGRQISEEQLAAEGQPRWTGEDLHA